MALEDEVKKYRFVKFSDAPASGSVTSRDQIIDPYSVVDVNDYGMGRRGQANYKQALESAKRYAEQQEAAYQEWYESPEQVALRQRAAGINPDLVGLADSEAADTVPSASTPIDNLPTNGQIAGIVGGTIASIVGAIVTAGGTLAALPATLAAAGGTAAGILKQNKLTDTQIQGQEMSNLATASANFKSGISSKLADAVVAATAAGKEFDYDAFFADETNLADVFEANVPEGVTKEHSQYGALWRLAKSTVQSSKRDAFKIASESLGIQSTFAELVADPTTDFNLLFQIAQNEPIMKAIRDMERLQRDFHIKLLEFKDPVSEAQAINAKNKFETDYFNGFEGDQVALYEFTAKKFQAIKDRAIGSIYDNLWSTYNSNPYSMRGLGASYLIMGGQHLKWYEYLGAFGLSAIDTDGLGSITDPVSPFDAPMPGFTMFGTPAFVGGSGYRNVSVPYIPGNFGD